MRTIASSLFAALCGLLTISLALPAAAGDVPIAAKLGMVKPGKLAKVLSKAPGGGFTLPAPGGADDPTLGGAELHLFDTALTGGSLSVTLGAAGWKGLGKPAGSKGYKYKGKADPGSPCSVVLLKPTVIKAVCKGAAITLTTPFDGDLAAEIALPAGTAAATRYCAALGGTAVKNDATQLKRKDAPARGACAEVDVDVAFDANDVAVLADDAMQGRNNNTAGSLAAQAYLIDELQEMGAAGLDANQAGDDAYKQPFVQSGSIGTNILAIIPGSELPDEYVMIGAHYDHVGSCRNVEMGDTVCNGATDNAAGTAAVLAVGRTIAALPTPPRRSIILALWDAEEDGLRGSLFYSNNPVVPLTSTVAYINLDIQGANLLPSLRNFTFAVGAETGTTLGALAAEAASGTTLAERQLSYIFGQARSDYVNIAAKNVPTIFYSDSTGPCYHTNNDEVAVVDFGKLEQQTQRALSLTLMLANTTEPPAFVPPLSPLATFNDAVILDEVLTAGLDDLGLFAPAEQAELINVQATIHQIVLDGPGAFDNTSMATLLNNTVAVIDLLTETACDGFLAP